MSNDPVETAWRIHEALVDWTGKVDQKASFALTLESALIAGVVTMSGKEGPLSQLNGGDLALGLYRGGVTALIVATLCAVAAVIPRIRWRHIGSEAPEDFVYFGHLKDWTSKDLEGALRTRDVLPVLVRQHLRMSQIAYEKHLLVQVSLGFAVLASIALFAATQLASTT